MTTPSGTNVYQLLADVIGQFPELAQLTWSIKDQKAKADLTELGGLYTRPDPDHPGSKILVIVPAPSALAFANQLHEAGWKRSGDRAGQYWELEAYLRRGGAEVRILCGIESQRPDGIDHPGIPFFAPPPPELSRKKSFRPAYREWERKCHEDEW